MTTEIASAKFHVYGTTSWGHPVDKQVTLHLGQSGAFGYGNGLAVRVEYDGGGIDQLYDVRYDRRLRRDGSNYTEWVKGFANDIFDSALTVEMIEE